MTPIPRYAMERQSSSSSATGMLSTNMWIKRATRFKKEYVLRHFPDPLKSAGCVSRKSVSRCGGIPRTRLFRQIKKVPLEHWMSDLAMLQQPANSHSEKRHQ
jgi:hypothetical protein